MANLAAETDPRNCMSDRDHSDLYQAILEVSRILTDTSCIRVVYKKFARELQGLLEFDRANITLVDEIAGTVTVYLHFGQEMVDWPPNEPRKLQGTRAHRVLATGETVIENDISSDGPISRASADALTAGLRSSIAVPLKVGGRIFGLLSMRCRRSGAFGPREQTMLEYLANLIALSVNREILEEQLHSLSQHSLSQNENNGLSLQQDVRHQPAGVGPALLHDGYCSVNCEALSSRECQVLNLLAQGANNSDIAASLQISGNTVKTHVRSILRKLKVSNRVQAALWARGRLVNGNSPVANVRLQT